MALLLIAFALSMVVLAAPLQNITITVPEGTSNHGDPRLLCTPTKATDVIVFFLGNYLAHVATILPLPGEAPIPLFLAMVSTLFYPTSGVCRGIDAIKRHAIFYRSNPLKTALRAGALAEVVRTRHWEPQPGDQLDGIEVPHHPHGPNTPAKDQVNSTQLDPRETDREGATEDNVLPQQETVDAQEDRTPTKCARLDSHTFPEACFEPATSLWSSGGRIVHGHCRLPKGYALAILPPDAKLCYCDIPNKSTESESDAGHGFKDMLNWKTGLSWCIDCDPGDHGTSNHSTNLCSSYSVPRVVFSIFQLMYASFTLYRTKGDQLDKYGYAAFGLTVTPYLVMSFVNLLGSLFTPTYPSVYLVQTRIMEEAKLREGGFFEGMIGKIDSQFPCQQTQKERRSNSSERFVDDHFRLIVTLSSSGREWEVKVGKCEKLLFTGKPFEKEGREREEQDTENFPCSTSWYTVVNSTTRSIIMQSISTGIGSLTFAIIGPLSHFKNGESTKAQRGWTMAWLVLGISCGPLFYLTIEKLSNSVSMYSDGVDTFGPPLFFIFFFALYGAPAVGGMVVVGQMLVDYGSCIKVG